jgi:hypothetical protein
MLKPVNYKFKFYRVIDLVSGLENFGFERFRVSGSMSQIPSPRNPESLKP